MAPPPAAPALRRRDVNYANLRSLYDTHGAEPVCTMLREQLEKKALSPDDFSLQEIAEVFLPDWRRVCRPKSHQLVVLKEDAVDSTAFANITGQIVYTKVLEGWEEADAGVFEQLCTVVPTRFNGEKIPGMSEPADDEFEVNEGMPIDEGSFGEHYVETPVTKKFGQIILVTKEAIFFDRTGLILQQAAKVGERLAMGRLKRLMKVVAGVTNNYKFDGSAKNTYQTALGDWINQQVNPLVDWRDVEQQILLLQDIAHPDTGNPMAFTGGPILTAPALAMTAHQIVNATEVRKGDGAAGSSTSPVTIASNPVTSVVTGIITSAILKKVLVDSGVSASVADGTWFYGQFKKAFAYMQNWDLTIATLDSSSEIAFFRDVVSGHKATERGVAFAMEPRWVTKATPS